MKRIIVGAALCAVALCAADRTGRACRFWGLVGGGYPADLIAEHLRDGTASNLQRLGGANTDGWGIGYFVGSVANLPFTGPITRRGGPRANHPNVREFNRAVDEMTLIRPKAAIAHVRAASSGHTGIPDPHPFQHEGILFAHNGSIPEAVLVDLLTNNDPNYMEDHPPDYKTDYIDSELYFMYLLKYVHEHPHLARTEALRRAIDALARAVSARLNFVMTAGDTLIALRCAPFDVGDPVEYYPAMTAATSSFWVAASQPLGSHPTNWAPIPARTLAVFVPGRRPVFLPIGREEADGLAAPGPGLRLGFVSPNPAPDAVEIPILGAPAGADVTVEIFDVQGGLVWKGGPIVLGGVEPRIRWDARDLGGHRVASGSYFCRVRVGREILERQIHMIR